MVHESAKWTFEYFLPHCLAFMKIVGVILILTGISFCFVNN